MEHREMMRCWDKMCFLQVWLMCFGSTGPSRAETFPNTLLCLKGACGSEENHPVPQHLGKSGQHFLTPGLCMSITFCFLLCCHCKEPLSSTSGHLGSFTKGTWHKAGLELKSLLNYCWIWGGKEVWSSLTQPAQEGRNEICTLGSSWPEPVKSSRFSQYVL